MLIFETVVLYLLCFGQCLLQIADVFYVYKAIHCFNSYLLILTFYLLILNS